MDDSNANNLSLNDTLEKYYHLEIDSISTQRDYEKLNGINNVMISNYNFDNIKIENKVIKQIYKGLNIVINKID